MIHKELRRSLRTEQSKAELRNSLTLMYGVSLEKVIIPSYFVHCNVQVDMGHCTLDVNHNVRMNCLKGILDCTAIVSEQWIVNSGANSLFM